MDSPSPRSEHTRFYEDDESNQSLASVWNSLRPFHRALSVLAVSLVLAALFVASLPMWSPMGALMLHKLWEALRFLVLATSIGLGILNIGLWRGISDEDDSTTSSTGKEDSFRYKVPFSGMFYGEGQHSYSFSDRGTGASEHGLMYSIESESRDVGPAADAATSTDREGDVSLKGEHDDAAVATSRDGHHGNEASGRADADHQSSMQAATSSVPIGRAGIAHERDVIRVKDFHGHKGEIDGTSNDEVLANPLRMHRHHVSENVVLGGKNKLVKPYDDLGLASVAGHAKQSRSSKIIHRRGGSLDFPITEGEALTLEKYAALNHQISASQSKFLSPEKAAASTNVEVSAHVAKKGSEPSGSSSAMGHRVERVDGGGPGTTSKHSRSQSAYNFDELLVQHRPRSKPSTSGQLSKRRNVSLSCDLDKEYSGRGAPAWLTSLPSPPVPPFMRGNDSVEIGGRHTDLAEGKDQDESSLRRAYTESLAPWRAITNAVPVSIPTHTHKDTMQSNRKGPPNKTVEKQITENTTWCPSPTNTLGSPSPRELNKKVDAFIARFHERMRLQRLESLERLKQRGHQ